MFIQTPLIPHEPVSTPTQQPPHLNAHALAVLLGPPNRLARLLDLLQHGVKGDVVGVDVCGLGFQAHGVGGEAWKRMLVGV